MKGDFSTKETGRKPRPLYGDALKRFSAKYCPQGHERVTINFLPGTRTCKICSYQRSANWNKMNSEKHKLYSKRTKDSKHYQAKKYGLTPLQYDLMLKERNGLCDICGKPEIKKRLSIDHDHSTGKVRGLLCDKCNNGLGKFEDSSFLLVKASTYLLRSTRGTR